MTERRQSLLLFLVFTYVCLFTESVYSARYLALRVVGHLLPILLLGPRVARLIRHGQGFVLSGLDRPLRAWLGIALIASLAGLSPRLSMERAWLYFVYMLTFYALLQALAQGRERSIFRALFMTGGLVCLMALFEWVSWYLGLSFLPDTAVAWPTIKGQETLIPPVWHRLNATLGGSTPLAAFLALLIPPAIGWMLTTESAQTRRGLGLWLAVALMAEILTFSRGGILALAVSLPLTGLGWAAAQRDWLKRLRRWLRTSDRRTFWAWIVPTVLLIALAATFWLSNSFAGRRGSTTHRFTLWQVAFEAFRAHPVLGVGPANFGRALLYRNDGTFPRRQIQTAHNAYLNTAAELGLFGLLAGAWALSEGVSMWVKNWRDAPTRRRVRTAACVAALAGLAAQLLVDTFTAPAIWLPGLILTASALTPAQDQRPFTVSRSRPLWPVVAMLLLVVSTGWLGWNDVAQLHFQRSGQLLRRNDFEEASQEAEKAQQMDPGLSLYAFQRAHIQGMWSTVDERSSLTDQALAHYRAALSIDPVWGKQTANLAGVLWDAGSSEETLLWMERTVQANPRPIYLINLGIFYEGVGKEMQAWEAYGRALASAPSLAGSGFWQADPDREGAWSEIMRQAEDRVFDKDDPRALVRFRTQTAWAMGDDEEVERQAHSLTELHPGSAEGYIWLARSLLSQGRAADALLAAERAAAIAPRSSSALAVRGCARWRADKNPAALKDLEIALFISSGTRDAHVCMGEIHEDRGELEAAVQSYSRALGKRAVSQDVEMTLYKRLATFEPLPSLVRVGMGEQTASPQLRAASLLEQMGRCEKALAIYQALLAEDEYLNTVQTRLEALPCYLDGASGE